MADPRPPLPCGSCRPSATSLLWRNLRHRRSVCPTPLRGKDDAYDPQLRDLRSYRGGDGRPSACPRPRRIKRLLPEARADQRRRLRRQEGGQAEIEILSTASADPQRLGRDGQGGSIAAARKGWDGSVKGGNVADTDATAKFGAISQRHTRRQSSPIRPPRPRRERPFTRFKTNVVARTAPPTAPLTQPARRRQHHRRRPFRRLHVGAQYAECGAAGARRVRLRCADVEIASCPAPAAADQRSAGE